MGFEVDADGETLDIECLNCGHVGLKEIDGLYYCTGCCQQAEGLMDTGVADEDCVEKGGEGALYKKNHSRVNVPTPTPVATVDTSSLIWARTQEQKDAETTADNDNKNGGKSEPGDSCEDGVLGPTDPGDFGSAAVVKIGYEDYYNEVRIRYVMGMQWMIELQCEALVRDFHVNPLICGIASTVWLGFLAGTRVFKDDWADRVLIESEVEPQLPDRPQECKLEPIIFDESQGADSQIGLHSLSIEPHAISTNEPHAVSKEEPGSDDLPKRFRKRYRDEPYNSRGQRGVMIWFRRLRKTIPLSSSLAIVFLACHVAREAVLPTDIIKWSIEGKLPYFAAHVEIRKKFEHPSPACPISTSLMFRPYQPVPLQKLESMAAIISESIGLHLPPVNFYEIASRYLKQLSLPVEKILPTACRIYEWSMPPDLWLSTNATKLPTRVYVLSMVIVAIRIQYDINGFGFWERSLSTHIGMNPETTPRKLNDFGGEGGGNAAEELLFHLEKKYHELSDDFDFAKDLRSYLKYCKNTIFVGGRSSHLDPGRGTTEEKIAKSKPIDRNVEEELIEKLMEFYLDEKKYSEVEGDSEAQLNSGKRSTQECVQNQLGEKRTKTRGFGSLFSDIESQHELPGYQDSDTSSSERNSEHCKVSSPQDDTLRQLKLNMEENRFSYMPPRVNIKRRDYLHYVRKKDVGFLSYVAHADYYILLRACAKVAQVDIRIMHIGVLSFERRLAWLEERIDHCLHSTPSSITCELCSGALDDDLVGLSQLDI